MWPVSGHGLKSLGKTVISLTVIKQLIEEYLEATKTLVIAPKRVAEDTWPREHLKWDHLKDLKMVEIKGSPTQRRRALEETADVYIITRDNISWLVEELQTDWPFDTVIIDELSGFKSHQSKRFKKLRTVKPAIKRVIGLTGTPAPNGYLDLWSQIYLLDCGKRLGKTITSFRSRYCDTMFRPGYNEYRLKDGAKQEIDQALSSICISMKARDYLTMKEPLYIDRHVHLDPKERRIYENMEKEALLELGDGEEIAALSAAAVTNKLLQLANGAAYDAEKKYHVIHDKKIEMLNELLEEAAGEPVLVFYNYQSDKDRIKKAIPEVRTLETDTDIKDWNDKKIKVLLAHPASAGHGLNLQDGGSIIVWFGLNWSLELYLQANARLYRQGQKETVRIYHILTNKTIDEKVLKVLQGKNIRQEDLLRELKAEKGKS